MSKKKETEQQVAEEEAAIEQEAKEIENPEKAEDSAENETEQEQSKIDELEEELAQTKDSLLRKAAELDNVRKRVQRERIQLFEEAKAGALEDFMPLADDLLRTLKAAEESEIENSFLEGVTLVAEKFKNVLEKHGVERIDETGVPFDVNLHDAMLKQPAPDDKTESDVVLQILESGYKIGNRTIRHAKVIVSE